MGRASRSRRVRIERGIYLQPDGKYAVCLRRAGRLCYHAVGFDLELARRERQRLIAATQDQLPPPAARRGAPGSWRREGSLISRRLIVHSVDLEEGFSSCDV